MQRPAREDRGPPRYFEVARVRVSCPTTEAHARALILAHATIDTDGGASWVEEGHARVGYVQAGPCCHRPEAHSLEAGAASEYIMAMTWPGYCRPWLIGVTRERVA